MPERVGGREAEPAAPVVLADAQEDIRLSPLGFRSPEAHLTTPHPWSWPWRFPIGRLFADLRGQVRAEPLLGECLERAVAGHVGDDLVDGRDEIRVRRAWLVGGHRQLPVVDRGGP